MKSYACNNKHTVVGPSCSLIDCLCSLSALSYVTGVQILWIWTLALRSKPGGFPGGAVVENPPANAGDTGSSPGLGRSHIPRSNRAREPQLLSLSVWSLCSATREAAIVTGPRTAMKSGPHSLQLEKALTQKRRPDTAKNKHNKKIKNKN